MIRRLTAVLFLSTLALASSGCVHRARPFDAHFDAARWTEASDAFIADSSLMRDEDALYRAGLLYGTPGRPTYRPERSDSLLRRLLTRFPETKHRAAATERLAIVEALIQDRERFIAVERRVSELTVTVQGLRQRLDSAAAQSDSLRRSATRLEVELRDRDEQLRAARLELQRLKEIDLKRSPPPRRPPTLR